MTKALGGKRKRRSALQKAITEAMRLKALDLRRQKTTDSSSTSALNESPIFSQHTSQISKELDAYKAKYNAVQKKYHNERRRNRRLEEANREWKDKAKQARTSHSRTQGYVLQLEKQLGVVQSDAEQVVGALEDRVHNLKDSMKDLNKKHSILRRRCRRLEKMNQNLKQRKKKMMINRPSAFRLRYKGTYTAEARALARYMVATGTAEAKVGEAIQRIGSVMGLDVEHKMSKRTVQRAVMEGGIAGDIQLAVEILGASKLCFSSDSTSHRHIEYESRTIALQVIDYNDPNAKPAWRMRTLGVDTSVNHTSETQVEGLKKRLQEIAEIFNSSPLAIREGLHFDSDDFAFRLYGTSGDHAADQKKSHKKLKEWRMSIVLRRLGEEALYHMDPVRVTGLLAVLKSQYVQKLGGVEVWDKMDEEAREEVNVAILREVGRLVFENLPQQDQDRLSCFIRTGCCMHKDLNCFKAGDKEMQQLWTHLGLTPPILLANKDNTAILAKTAPGTRSDAATRAEQVSKRGGSHAALLGGLICRNKDKKKGQQDTYLIWMADRVGHLVPYPDVSQTRYGSHGAAAAVLVVHRPHFIEFMRYVHDSKEKPGFTNIEKNFFNALHDLPTVTELCVLALYHIAASKPFMAHVRKHENLLDLEPFFERKEIFLQNIFDKPELWTKPDAPYEDSRLDSSPWDDEDILVLKAVHTLSPELPHLDSAVKAFVKGARSKWVDSFSEEFREGGDISKLTASQRTELFFASTNDINEGALGSWRLAQRHRSAETLHKFNSSFKARQNDTESFISNRLQGEADQAHLRKTAREFDRSGKAAQMRRAQLEADRARIEENRQKEAKRVEKRTQQQEALKNTANNLVLTAEGIDKLNVEALNKQLDFHRDVEKDIDMEESLRVPKKTHIGKKEDRIRVLKAAVVRYLQRTAGSGPNSESEKEPDWIEQSIDLEYESDYNDDGI